MQHVSSDPRSLVIQVLVYSKCNLLVDFFVGAIDLKETWYTLSKVKTKLPARYRGVWGYMLHNKKVLYLCPLSYKKNNFWVTSHFKGCNRKIFKKNRRQICRSWKKKLNFVQMFQDLPSGYNSGEQYDTLSTGIHYQS